MDKAFIIYGRMLHNLWEMLQIYGRMLHNLWKMLQMYGWIL